MLTINLLCLWIMIWVMLYWFNEYIKQKSQELLEQIEQLLEKNELDRRRSRQYEN